MSTEEIVKTNDPNVDEPDDEDEDDYNAGSVHEEGEDEEEALFVAMEEEDEKEAPHDQPKDVKAAPKLLQSALAEENKMKGSR